MKTIVRKLTNDATWPAASHANAAGEKFNLRVIPATVDTPESYQEFQTPNLADVVSQMGLTSLKPAPIPRPTVPPIQPTAKKIPKFDLIEKLVALNVVEEFYALIGSLPLAERLKWDAAQNVAENYPFLVENKAAILSTLGITEEQFSELFS